MLAASLLLRSLARFAWRRLTPPERVPSWAATGSPTVRRKLELFPDMHAGGRGVPSIRHAGGRDARLAAADRIIVALETIDEALIAELVAACRAAAT